MPHMVAHEVTADSVRKGDVISIENDSSHHYGATVNEVKVGSKYATAFGPTPTVGARQQLFRLERKDTVWVDRSEATPEENEAAMQEWLERRATGSLARMKFAYLEAVKNISNKFAADVVPSDEQIHELIEGQRLADYAARLQTGIELHPDKSVNEIFVMLRDEIAARLLSSGSTYSRWSGGFSIGNAREQINHDVDARFVEAVDSHYMRMI